MTDLVHVTAVEVVDDHRLRLAFEDGAEGEVDLSGWQWRGVFEPLADLAPETLHVWAVRGLAPTTV